MDRTIFLEVHRGGSLKRTTGTAATVTTHTYDGGDVTTWRVPKADCTIWHLLAALGKLDDYHTNSFWFYEDISPTGKGFLAPLQRPEDAEALARLGERHAGIRVFSETGVKDIGDVLKPLD